MLFDVSMNGISLSSLHSGIRVLDISYEAPAVELDVATLAGRSGVILGDRKTSASVSIQFELHVYNPAERNIVCQAITAWAADGYLETSDRPGQRLYCVCTGYPTINSALKWTEPLAVTFTAYAVPYWQDKIATTASLTGSEASGSMYVPGNAKTLVEATITASAALSTVTVTVGDTSITLAGLSVAQDGVITVTYDNRAVLSIMYNGTSLLNKRTAASSDDLIAVGGAANDISVSASAAVTVVFIARGCWH